MSLMMKNWNNTLMKATSLFGGSWNPVGYGNINFHRVKAIANYAVRNINFPRVKGIANYTVDAHYTDAYTLEMMERIRAGEFGPGPGSYSPVKNINKVKEVADYAIAEYTKRSGANLKLEKVISCEVQVVGGNKYRLILATNEGFFKALVYTRPWENYIKLTYFDHLPSFQPTTA